MSEKARNRSPLYLDISDDVLAASKARTVKQEAKYGRNTGHFTLENDKNSTLMGVIGELLVMEALMNLAKRIGYRIQINQTSLGAPVDLEIKAQSKMLINGLHVKTGVWKQWPQEDYQFGVHADQKLETTSQPLVLVTLLKRADSYPQKSRIEGFITPEILRAAPLIERGERFDSTGVISRTDNLVTKFSQYSNLEAIFDLYLP